MTGQSQSKDIVDNFEGFIRRCTLLLVEQQVCISHICSTLGLRSLSQQWLSKTLDSIGQLGLLDVKEKVNEILHVMCLIKRDDELEGRGPRSLDRMSFYELGSLVSFAGGYKEKPRVFIHFAFAALHQRLHKSAMAIFEKIGDVYESPMLPSYYDELSHAINAQIIIQVKANDMDGALRTMHRRLDVISRWIGNTSVELAKELHRLGCLYSVLGQHEQCAKHLNESLQVGVRYDSYNVLDCFKLLAVTYDNMGGDNKSKAIHQYECALSREKDILIKARLMNAISHLLIQVGGRRQHAVEYLQQSLNIQQDDANDEGAVFNLLCDTMILYGNIMASENSFSEALDWYESALSSNPDKNILHSSNLRACYNKGFVLFQNRDLDGAIDVFGIIIDEVNKNPTSAPIETIPILSAIGSIYYLKQDFATAIKHFTQCLSLRNRGFSSSQRAGTLCNIGTAHYKMESYKKSETFFLQALAAADTIDGISDLKATILCKLAHILYKRKQYDRAHPLFSKGKTAGLSVNILCMFVVLMHFYLQASTLAEDFDDKLSKKIEGYAVMCHLQLSDQPCKSVATTTDGLIFPELSNDEDNGYETFADVLQKHPSCDSDDSKITAPLHKSKSNKDTTIDKDLEHVAHTENVADEGMLLAQKQKVPARKPKFEGKLIPILNDYDAIRYSSAVYSWATKMLAVLGVEPASCDSIASSLEDRNLLCDTALDHLLDRTKDLQAKYELEFEGLLVDELNPKFTTTKSLLENEISHKC